MARWVDARWPLVVRRAMPGEGPGVPLGLPLPPSAGKRRIPVLLPADDILATSPPPSLRFAYQASPGAWRRTIEAVEALTVEHQVEARVFGSLAWRALTGLDYLSGSSDLDLLLHVRGDVDVQRLTAELAEIEAGAPMRLDGELVRGDGAAVNWREFHAGAGEVLVKTIAEATLATRDFFLPADMPI